MRLHQLTFTRFIAAISIVIFHFGSDIAPFNRSLKWVIQHPVGVNYFFILSGYILVIAYQQKSKFSVAGFYIHRFARIYPVYIFGLILTIVSKLFFGNEPIVFFDVILSLTMLQAWISNHALILNVPGWSLCSEAFFYLLFPFYIVHILKAKSFSRVVIAVILIWAVSITFSNVIYYSSLNKDDRMHDFLLYFPPMHLNEFFVGNLAALFYLRFSQKLTRNYDLALLLLCAALLAVYYFEILKGPNYDNGFLAVLFIPFIVLMSLNTGLITKIFSSKKLIFLGDISYGIYIFHWPVFLYTQKYFSDRGLFSDQFTFYISLIVLVLVAGMSYVYVEVPIRERIKNKAVLKLP